MPQRAVRAAHRRRVVEQVAGQRAVLQSPPSVGVPEDRDIGVEHSSVDGRCGHLADGPEGGSQLARPTETRGVGAGMRHDGAVPGLGAGG